MTSFTSLVQNSSKIMGILMSGLDVEKHLINHGTKIPCNTENYVPVVVPDLSSGTSSSRVALPSTTYLSKELLRENLTQRLVK